LNSDKDNTKIKAAVDKATLAPHFQLRTAKHEFKVPVMPGNDAAFRAKVAKANAAAESDGVPVMSFFTDDWDPKKMPSLPKEQFLVVETKPGVQSGTNLQVFIDEQLAQSGSKVQTGRAQTYTIELEPVFFVEKVGCAEQCNPDNYNPISFRVKGGVDYNLVKQAVTVTDVTDPAHEVPVRSTVKKDIQEWNMHGSAYSLDKLGYSLQPARTYRVRVDPSLEAEDGQKLGYAWTATVEYWHRAAFTSFGTMSWYTFTLASSRRRRPAGSLRSVAPPAFSLTPAVMITTPASAISA
jgi:hypothetical protein